MIDFPNSFDEQTKVLPTDNIGAAGVQAAQKLSERGYEVHYGLTAGVSDDIAQMALEPAIREFCPNDFGGRFANRDATENWLSKRRAVFLLMKKSDSENEAKMVGYGWVGLGASSHVPDGETTFAIRIGEAGQGQGLATPFAQLIVSGAAVVYGAKNMWLETWQSNAGAVHIYHKIGFEDVDSSDDERVSGSGEIIKDTRLYMSLPNQMLPLNP